MTVCCAIVVPGQGAVLGCDSRVSNVATADILSDACEKFIVAGSVTALISGDIGLLDHIVAARNIEGLRMLAAEYSDGRGLSWDLLTYCRKSERLVYLDQAGVAQPLGEFYATGSGAGYALGCLSSSPRPKDLIQAQKLVRKAVRIAIKHNAACGGRIRVLTVRGKRSPVEIS